MNRATLNYEILEQETMVKKAIAFSNREELEQAIKEMLNGLVLPISVKITTPIQDNGAVTDSDSGAGLADTEITDAAKRITDNW